MKHQTQSEAKRFFLETWKQLSDIEGKNIVIPVKVQEEIIQNIQRQLDDIRSEIAQELLDMEVA